MKNLLYIGNKLSTRGKTATTIDTLSNALIAEGYNVKAVSSKKNKLLRLIDMVWSIIKNRSWAHYVLIDTYSTQNFYYALVCSQLCRFFKLKYVPILHGGNLPNRLKNNPKLSHAIFNNAFVNVAPSNYTALAFKDYGFNNITIIPNAINIENYAFKQREIDEVHLLWVRSFSKIYNPKLAVDVLFQLQKKEIKSSLTMVGPDNDGSLEVTKKHAASLNVAVNFTGKLSKKEWITLSKTHNIFINTTNFDNMPVSVIEAMALGLPIISTNVGGLPFLIEDDVTGKLVSPNNAALFVDEIIDLKENKEKVENYTRSARNRVEQFGWQVVKNQWKVTLI
ncbi:glycosyltransferase family 4 protein [Lacinutrix chionoecetis]